LGTWSMTFEHWTVPLLELQRTTLLNSWLEYRWRWRDRRQSRRWSGMKSWWFLLFCGC